MSDELRVGVLAFDDALGFEVFGFVDIVNFAGHIADLSGHAPRCRMTVSLVGPRPKARIGGGARIDVDASAKAFDHIDLLVVPGFDTPTPGDIDALVGRCGDVVELIRSHAATDRPVMSICLGAFLLADAGVLDGRRATTAWPFATHLAASRPDVTVDARQMIIRDGPVTTSAAFSSVLDLGLDVVREQLGSDIARTTAKVTLADGRTSQAPYIDQQIHAVRRASFSDQVNARILEAPEAPWTLAALADAVHVSTRTLSRRYREETGETPITFVHRARVSAARELLESTDLPLGVVMSEVGYSDPTTFRKRFQTLTGLSPATYRGRFRRPA